MYNCGVVLLEMLSGRRALDKKEEGGEGPGRARPVAGGVGVGGGGVEGMARGRPSSSVSS